MSGYKRLKIEELNLMKIIKIKINIKSKKFDLKKNYKIKKKEF